MAISYENSWFSYALEPISNKIIDEFPGANVYIAPDIRHKTSFSIRLWSDRSETFRYLNDEWQKQYNIQIYLYFINSQQDQVFYKTMYDDIERVYQLLFNNKKIETTVNTGTDSRTLSYIDGIVEDIEINTFEGEEEEIIGLNVAKINFSCKINRSNE